MGTQRRVCKPRRIGGCYGVSGSVTSRLPFHSRCPPPPPLITPELYPSPLPSLYPQTPSPPFSAHDIVSWASHIPATSITLWNRQYPLSRAKISPVMNHPNKSPTPPFIETDLSHPIQNTAPSSPSAGGSRPAFCLQRVLLAFRSPAGYTRFFQFGCLSSPT
jgi:hypothetical protein